LSLEIVDVSGCKRNLLVEVPVEEIDGEIDRLAREYAQKVKVPGFRPGKVPLHIIKQRFKEELQNDATQDIIQRSWKDAIDQNKLQPLAEPVVENVRKEPGSPLKFTVTFEIMPAVEVRDYQGLSATLPSAKVEDADVDKAIEALREKQAQFIPVENGEIQDGHLVALTVDGELGDGGKPLHEENVNLIIGDSQTDAAFSDNLRGARVGELRSFEVSYPADYQRKRLAGKTAHYSVKVNEIKEKQLSELNDDFAIDLGEQSLQSLRTRINDDLVTRAQKNAEKKAREELLDRIVQQHPFDVPNCLVQDEQEDYARRIAGSLAQQGIDFSKASIDWRKIFDEDRPRAEKAVRQSIVLDAIARQEGLDVSEEELDAEFQKLAEGTNKSAAAIKAQFDKDKRIQDFREHLRRNKALDFIYRNANISGG
jgi:trigger factor